MFYEDMNKDLPCAIKKMATFLGKNMTDRDVKTLETHLKIENFRLNSSVNMDLMADLGITNNKQGFIRKGKSGSWKDMFDEELNRRADKWITENLKDSDIVFPS